MALTLLAHIDLPPHRKPGGFDHAAIHRASGRAFVAHTSNDALDVIDCTENRYLYSIPDLPGVAGVLVSQDSNLVFTSNRDENTVEVPVAGPHGLDVDSATGRLFCACDAGELVILDALTGRVVTRVPISGIPDVVFLHPARRRVYVAVGDPGVVDVIDTAAVSRIQSVPTERGGKTTALDIERGKLYVFLPETHRAAVFVDS